jgi:hypothetical protein
MEDRVREDIIGILLHATSALRQKNSMMLREASDHTIHNASIYQDKDSITVAVLVYALSKVVDRISKSEPKIVGMLTQARRKLKEGNVEDYERIVKSLMKLIAQLDTKLDLYIQKVINEAEIKKGSRLYEHGISLAQTAELLGITQWELMKYLGQTRIADQFDDAVNVQERLSYARRIFQL